MLTHHELDRDYASLTPEERRAALVQAAIRRAHAERAMETLAAGKPKSVGAVLNRVDFDRNKYYYTRYYGHHYQNYYGSSGRRKSA